MQRLNRLETKGDRHKVIIFAIQIEDFTLAWESWMPWAANNKVLVPLRWLLTDSGCIKAEIEWQRSYVIFAT